MYIPPPLIITCTIPPPFILLHIQWVDYRGISKSHKFEAYVRATAELKRVDLLSLSVEEKIAFFLNVYNALVVHGFVVLGPPTNHLKRYRVRDFS